MVGMKESEKEGQSLMYTFILYCSSQRDYRLTRPTYVTHKIKQRDIFRFKRSGNNAVADRSRESSKTRRLGHVRKASESN